MSAGKATTYFYENGLRFLQADKGSGFVVIPSGIFHERATAAVSKSFYWLKRSKSSVKTNAVDLCKSYELDSLADGIKSSRANTFDVFLPARARKPDIMSWTVVNEKGTW